MANEKLIEEYRKVIEDNNVPMKTKVGINAAMTGDIYALVNGLNEKLDDFMEDQSMRLAVVEIKQEKLKEEVGVLQKLSNRNDFIGSIAAIIVAVLTAIGLKQ